jgi:hypothetical protein
MFRDFGDGPDPWRRLEFPLLLRQSAQRADNGIAGLLEMQGRQLEFGWCEWMSSGGSRL